MAATQRHRSFRYLCRLVLAVTFLLIAILIPIAHELAALHHFQYVLTCLTDYHFYCKCDGWNATQIEKQEALRLQTDICGYCKGYESVDRVSNISCEEYTQVYGLTGRPVIVTDAMRHWNVSMFVEGLQRMSLQTYRELYNQAVESGTKDKVFSSFYDILYSGLDPESGQYSTPDKFFATADEVVMNDTWYINWITDDKSMFDFLDMGVKDPYFFAPWSTHASQMWFFLGRLAEDKQLEGRTRHVDTVKMSGTWHGQLLGEKEWRFWPAQECQSICPDNLTVNVQMGEMILVNTDLWEHETSMPVRSSKHQFSFSVAKDYYLSSRFLLRNLPGDPFRDWLVPWKYTFGSMYEDDE